MAQLIKSAAWQALQAHHKTFARIHMRDLFAQEPNRFERLSLRFDDLLLHGRLRLDGAGCGENLDLAGLTLLRACGSNGRGQQHGGEGGFRHDVHGLDP